MANVAFQHLKSSSDYLGFCQGQLFISLGSAVNLYFCIKQCYKKFQIQAISIQIPKEACRVTIISITPLGFPHLNPSVYTDVGKRSQMFSVGVYVGGHYL